MRFRIKVAVGIASTLLILPAAAQAARPSFSLNPKTVTPKVFDWGVRDYAVRDCQVREGVRLRLDQAPGWRIRFDGKRLRRSVQSMRVKLAAGEGIAVTAAKKTRGARRRTFHLRCLPGDFPAFDFDRERDGGNSMFSLQLGGSYGAIFSSDGVPIWWLKASGEPDNVQVLDDGTVTYDPVDEATFQTGSYQIRTLTGRLIRVVEAVGETLATDVHDIQLLDNGNYLIGAQAPRSGVDTSAFGGTQDSTVIDAEIQEVTPGGRVVWRWNSSDHIALEETGRWWDREDLDSAPYDIVHWNSADIAGNYLLLSFRHLDAVYKIDRRTGRVVWKLGGTPTPDSLELRTDPEGDYPLGGQHDARFLSQRTISVYDNRTGLGTPRAVSYRIDETRGVARLVDGLSDGAVQSSFCCGSARRLKQGGWLIGWGGDSRTTAYDDAGRRVFEFSLAAGFSYRAIPIDPEVTTRTQLRQAMDAMASRG